MSRGRASARCRPRTVRNRCAIRRRPCVRLLGDSKGLKNEVKSSGSSHCGGRGRYCNRRDGRTDRRVRWRGEGSRNVDHDDHHHTVVIGNGVADREVDQPHRRQPVHASGQGASRADGHSWRQLTSRGLGSRRFSSPWNCQGGNSFEDDSRDHATPFHTNGSNAVAHRDSTSRSPHQTRALVPDPGCGGRADACLGSATPHGSWNGR